MNLEEINTHGLTRYASLTTSAVEVHMITLALFGKQIDIFVACKITRKIMVKKEIIMQGSMKLWIGLDMNVAHIYITVFKFVASVSFFRILLVNYQNNRNYVITSHKSNFVMSR